MAAPTPLGIVTLTSGGGTITVPTGATGAVAFWGEYGCFSGMTTFSSSFCTANTSYRHQTPSIGGTHNGTGLWAFDVTATGSQTFTPTWSNAPIQGPALSIAFFKDLDANWKDSARFATNHNQYSTTSGSVTAETDAYILVFESQDGGSAPSVPSGRTLVQNRSENSIGGVFYYVNSPTAGTNTITSGNSNFPGIAIASIKGASGGGAQTLLPPLTTRTRTVYAPTIKGLNTLTPPLTTRTRTVYAPVVKGLNTLLPLLVTRTRTVYAPTVTVGAVTLSPPLTTRTRTVYAPTVKGLNTILPPLTTRTRTVYAPVVAPGATTLLPPLVTRTRVIYEPVVSQPGSGAQDLFPPLTTRTRTIYAPTVIPGDVDLLPPLVTRGRTVYAPTVKGINTLIPPLTTRSRSVYAPTVAVGAVTLFPPLVTRSRAVYPPTVEGGIPVVATGGLFLPIVRRRRR